MAAIREELLHHIWKFRLFRSDRLRTVDGRSVNIIRTGDHNHDAGPDFLNARIGIDDIQLVGNVELHIRASDWSAHGHGHDPAYANVILHVVYEHDVDTPLGDFPTLELKDLVSDQVLRRYERLVNTMEPIACSDGIRSVEDTVLRNWLERVLMQRLERKSEWMAEVLQQCRGDLEQSFFIIMARTMGMKVNADAFEMLARRLPWKHLMRHHTDLLQLEALLFGMAGLLPTSDEDGHVSQLRREFGFLRHKYGLDPMSGSEWRYLRLRPANFPTVRLAQLAGMIHCCGALLPWYTSHFTKDDCPSLLARPSAYWDTHFSFGHPGKYKRKPLGATMQRHILINAVAPYMMVLAQREHRPELRDRAIEMLYAIEGEKNARIHPFRELGLKVPDAATAQALLELRSHYCDHRRCLNCAIGNQVLKRG